MLKAPSLSCSNRFPMIESLCLPGPGTRRAQLRDEHVAKLDKNLAEGVGIEPTSPWIGQGNNGFEVRKDHQILSTSVKTNIIRLF